MITPERMLDGALVCFHCDKPNAHRARFCAGCGDPLWEPCLACEQQKLIAEAFCNECGAGVQDQVGTALQSIAANMELARRLAQQHEYGRAMEALREVSKNEHFRFRDQLAEANRLMEELGDERGKHEQEAELALEQARTLADRSQWKQAAERLDGVPEAFWSEGFRHFRQTLRQKNKDRSELETELRETLKQGKLRESSAILENLLAVDPEHASAGKLAGKVTELLRRTARKEFKSHQYPQALETIRNVPSVAVDDQIRKEEEFYAELVCLNQLVRQTPYVDKTLLRLAHRISEMSPHDPRAEPILQRLKERLVQSAGSAAPPRWARPPERTLLETPIQRWPGCRRIGNLPAASDTFGGDFHVALGLALGGLGHGEIELNLKPTQRKGMLATFGGATFGGTLAGKSPVLSVLAGDRRKQSAVAWGLDLGRWGLKAVQLAVDESGQPRLLQRIELPHEQSAGDDVDQAGTLDRFATQHPIAVAEPVFVNLPGDKIMSRMSQLPPMDEKRLRQAIEYEVVHQIPIPKDELVWHCHLPRPEQRDFDRNGLIVAARRGEAERRVELFEQRDIKVQGLTGGAIALHNLAAYEGLLIPTDDPDFFHDGALALVDIGDRNTQVTFSWPGGAWCRCISQGVENWVAELSLQFKLTRSQATQLLQQPERARGVRRMVAVTESLNERLTNHLRQSLDAYSREIPERRIRRWLLVGGGSRLFGLLRYLRFGPLAC